MESVRPWSRCARGGDVPVGAMCPWSRCTHGVGAPVGAGVAHEVGAPVGAALPVVAMCPWGAAAGSKRGGGKWVLYALNDAC